MSKKNAKSINDINLFKEEIRKLEQDEDVRHMKDFGQHFGNNTLQHVRNVAAVSFRLAEKFGWRIDEKALARGAMLHDFYLYNIKEEGMSDYRHGIDHPKVALSNAGKKFALDGKEQNIIRSHMWPLTLAHPPRSKEAVLVCLADKYCATKEMVFHDNLLE